MAGTITVVAVLFAATAGAMDPLEGDLFMATTIVVPKPVLKSAILMHPANFTERKNTMSSYGAFGGYITKVGNAINITCNDSSGIGLTVERTFADSNSKIQVESEPGRVVVRRELSMIEVNILSAISNDSGRYTCGYDAKFLKVIEPSNPPRVLSHRCVSHSFDDLVCKFQTNTNKNDLVDWDIKFSVSEPRRCSDLAFCENQPCTSSWIEKSTDGRSGDQLVCKVEGWVFTELQYSLTVNGSNPYAMSLSTFNTSMNTEILQLQRPKVLKSRAGSVEVDIRTQLNDAHMSSKSGHGATGLVENAVFKYGIIYRITVDSEALRDTKHSDTVPMVRTFTFKSTTSWMRVDDLLPHTIYSFNIISQMNNTINKQVWSNSTRITMRTQQSPPEAAPECSSQGFTITRSLACAGERMVALFWQKLPETPGQGNGVITFYRVYNNGQLSLEIDEDTNYAEMCVGAEATELNVQPGNSAGYGSQMAKYFIPRERRTLQVRPCDISVAYNTSGDTLTVTWASLPQEYLITVFWCKLDVGLNCQNKELQWSEVEVNQTLFKILRWKETASKTAGSYGYKFGVNARTSNYSSSGIVWAHCINHVEKDLEPVEIEVNFDGLETTVTVIDRCHLGSRLAQYYTLKYCRYNKEVQTCALSDGNERNSHKEISEVLIDSCNKTAQIVLHKYGTEYAFWVVSHADASSVESQMIVKKTNRKALTWEIAVPVVLSLFTVVAITLCVVYFCRQKKRAQQFKHPQLVLATTAMMETEDMSNCPDEISDSSDSFTPYLTAEKPLMPPLTNDKNYPGALVPSDYQNKSQFDVSDTDSLDSNCLMKYECAKLTPTLSYQKPVSGTSGGNYRNTNAITSCGRLPDDYLQCTKAEPELSMSAQWFLGDDSNSNFIDLDKFLVKSDVPSPPKSVQEVELPPLLPTPEQTVAMEMNVCMESNNNRVADNRELTKAHSLSSGNVSDSSHDNNYHRITDYIPQPCPLQETAFTETQPGSPQSSSGDSGYVGRNARLNLVPLASSIPQSSS